MRNLFSQLFSSASPEKTIASWLDDELITRETAKMLEGVLNVASMHVRDVMVPKSMMCTIQVNTHVEEYLPTVIETGHSRFPLIDHQNDQALGIIMAKDILRCFYQNKLESTDLTELARPVKVIPESKRLNLLLREFRLSHKHMAVVMNEYGNISGLITIEDVLEQIVGDISDEYDGDDAAEIDRISENRYQMSALTPIEDCNQKLGTHFKTDAFDTVGGIVMNAFGHMPQRNESVDIDGHNITVIAADHRRIKQIVIQLNTENDEEET